MTIKDDNVLQLFRGAGFCELCRRWCTRRDPHHEPAKGMGGGSQLDTVLTLIAVGGHHPFPNCPCHNDIHRGAITSERVCQVIAARQKITVEVRQAAVYALLRLDKSMTVNAVLDVIKDEPEAVRKQIYMVIDKLQPTPPEPGQ